MLVAGKSIVVALVNVSKWYNRPFQIAAIQPLFSDHCLEILKIMSTLLLYIL